MSTTETLFDHVFTDNQAAKTLFLLHGTGGSKSDFLFFDDVLHHEYNLVGLAGNVSENGLRRFFVRNPDGTFDQESIATESTKLHTFLQAWQKRTKTTPADWIFLGYSNGANMILAQALSFPDIVQNGVILHGLLPFPPKKTLDLSAQTYFLTLGKDDPYISAAEQAAMIEALAERGAKLEEHHYETGHELSKDELRDVVTFLRREEES